MTSTSGNGPRDGGGRSNRIIGRHGPLRAALLALVLLQIAGLSVELVLLEHYESVWQWTPFVTLGMASIASVLFAVRPSPWSVRLFRGAMLLLVAGGLIGLGLHMAENRAFELEMDPSATGLALVWEVLKGATPALAPGALLQLGLLGLVTTIRHPAVTIDPPERETP